MESGNLKIVCYTGGTCGDLLSALIDPTNVALEFGAISHVMERQRLKKPHTFANHEEKDQYIVAIAEQYLSIPSHDLDYHILRNHKFIAITVQDFDAAMWAATRFRSMHRPLVWEEMQSKCGANNIEDYAQMLIHYSNMVVNHTGDTVKLEDILAGQAIDSLHELGIDSPHKNLYQDWLDLQNNKLIV
jgi:hypothetical protein